jgi:hypothetical protein
MLRKSSKKLLNPIRMEQVGLEKKMMMRRKMMKT